MNKKIREAVRIVLVNEKGEILLIHALKKNYYHLPGGGVNTNEESVEEAAKREALEETGYDVLVKSDLGIYNEFGEDMQNKSYGYLATITSKEAKNLMDDEKDFQNEWFSIENAKKILAQALRDNLDGRFEQFFARELEFITRAEKLLKKN